MQECFSRWRDGDRVDRSFAAAARSWSTSAAFAAPARGRPRCEPFP